MNDETRKQIEALEITKERLDHCVRTEPPGGYVESARRLLLKIAQRIEAIRRGEPDPFIEEALAASQQ